VKLIDYIFRENQENTVLLNEKLLSMEQKLTRSQAKCTRADELEVINQSLQNRLEDMENSMKPEPAASQIEVSKSGQLNYTVCQSFQIRVGGC